jgi:hypothetical protein
MRKIMKSVYEKIVDVISGLDFDCSKINTKEEIIVKLSQEEKIHRIVEILKEHSYVDTYPHYSS